MEYELKLVLVCLIVVPVVMLLFVANVCQLPELLLVQVAVMVSLSVSVQVMFSCTCSGSLVFPLVGCGLVCVGV